MQQRTKSKELVEAPPNIPVDYGFVNRGETTTMPNEKVILGWSGGKDSSLALQTVLQSNDYEVVALVTTVTDECDRISMHGVRRSLLHAQADAIDIPLHEVHIPPQR